MQDDVTAPDADPGRPDLDLDPVDGGEAVRTEELDPDGFADWFDREFDDELADGDLAAESNGDEPSPAGDGEAVRSLPARVGARLVRRPVDWWNRPWTNERVVRTVVTFVSLAATTYVMLLVVHFNPLVFLPFVDDSRDLILDDTTPTGGDMGAHVWAPAFLRDNFLPNLQISGWSMDWYGGLPLYRFYMVVPAVAIVLLDIVFPYGVAFKLVAMSGLITFPFACWAFGRLAAFRHPIPELFAFGGTCFLLDESFEIYGGNVKSTMAGEYSFSIALTLAVLGLGLLANGLRTGRYRVWAAVVLSLAAVSHGIVLIFVAVAATILCLVWVDRTRAVYAVTTGVTTLLLSAWWVGPFLFGHEFMTDMKYGYRPNSASDSFWDMFFPLTPALDILITGLAVVGFVAFVMRRQLTGVALGLIGLTFVALVYITRDSLPVIGLLWNPRLLPFFYLVRYLLMVVGALEVITWVVNAARGRAADRRLNTYEGAGAFAVIGLSILLVFGWMYETLPFDGRRTEGETQVYAWGPFRKGPESGRAVADGWTRYNWTGYEGRTAYPAYHHLVTTMDDLGAERGCGRAMWENNSANSEYGTTMALMLLPHWTDGCIASMEGLFFEATASTNYHFITAAAVSESSSNPVRQLRYTNNDIDVGVQHLRDLGVRYLMVRTDAAKAQAATSPDLEVVGVSGTWDIYEVTGSSVVEALDVQPVVVAHADGVERYSEGDRRERNLELGTSWFQRRDDWPALPVDDGPDEWQRVTAEIVVDERVEPFDPDRRRVDYVAPVETIEPVALPEVTVGDVEIEEQTVSFTVDQVGVPVLVRVSYFPNWHVDGAEGPYRAGANHMVVIPTANEVTLHYDPRSAIDWIFYAMTLLGVALCFVWRRRGDVVHAGPRPAFGRVPGPDDTAPLPRPVAVPDGAPAVRDSGDSDVTSWEPPGAVPDDADSVSDRHDSPE